MLRTGQTLCVCSQGVEPTEMLWNYQQKLNVQHINRTFTISQSRTIKTEQEISDYKCIKNHYLLAYLPLKKTANQYNLILKRRLLSHRRLIRSSLLHHWTNKHAIASNVP